MRVSRLWFGFVSPTLDKTKLRIDDELSTAVKVGAHLDGLEPDRGLQI